MNKIVVTESDVKGSVVGGDQHNVTYIVAAAPDPNVIRAGLDRIGALSEGDEEFQDFVELLNTYLADRAGRPVIGLQKKLVNGNREDLVEEAIEHKDRFAKIAARAQLSPRRQYIYFYILQKIKASFDGQIRPLLKSGARPEDIDQAIYHNIVNTIFAEVCSVDVSIDQYLIYGMLYFLTGKCHLVWEV
ncbi:hypothetical protein M1B35_29425 [Pseudomonas sp. MAFF 302046]|uniref:ABC-three component systems C-terminal domain-containing protein n=1 Tax=Pseudomonas morbosilactucae TaxID=2938197 RepID=A0ABT0JQW8_9PSED|nr:ABC-three component system protein [Pseudomonas morbosilactucae]MCK9818139.1 hypothetical protein [Pseudomonas morbosilactucae]